MKIKKIRDYLFNDNMIVNIEDFHSSLLEITKLWFKALLSNNINYIKYIPTKSPNHVSIDKNDNDEDYIYLFLRDVDGHMELNGIKYLIFFPTRKNKEALKHFAKIWEETEGQNVVINDD